MTPPESIIKSIEYSNQKVQIDDGVDIGDRHLDKATIDEMNADFSRLRSTVRQRGLLDASHAFYIRKVVECLALIGVAIVLQYRQWYVMSALVLGLAWQQLGWMIHEYCHHQHFKVVDKL